MMSSESKCPVLGGAHKHGATGSTANQHWWPNQLNLKILHQNDPAGSPMDADFDYAEAFQSLDHDALKADIIALMTDSQACWRADSGLYGPLLICGASPRCGT